MPGAPNATTRKDATINYEVDKTIQYVQQGGGGLKRLSVGVVVNYRKVTDKAGKVSMKPLTPAETAQITNLVKEAMGFNQTRGDTLNVVNSPFAVAEHEAIPELPMWKQPENIQLAKVSGKYLLMVAGLLLLYLLVMKPLMKKIAEIPALSAPDKNAHLHHTHLMQGTNGELLEVQDGQRSYQDGLTRAQKLANEDPRVVANIVKTWVGNNE